VGSRFYFSTLTGHAMVFGSVGLIYYLTSNSQYQVTINNKLKRMLKLIFLLILS